MASRSGDARLLFLFVSLSVILPSCANVGGAVHSRFESLQPGMSVSQVTSLVGTPDNLLGDIVNAFGQHVVVWEYEKITSRVILPSAHDTYWVYMVDGKFVKFTPKGDWQKEAAMIYRTDYSDQHSQ